MKYPRTYHLPWSPGGTKDDKKLKSVDSFLNKEIVITEKLDGSNSCLSKDGVFARSHGQSPTHKSFDLLKKKYADLKYLLKDNEQIFGENCFAVHSIKYDKLSDDFFVFNILNKHWLSFDEVVKRSKELNLTMAPVLFEGIITSSENLEKLTSMLMKNDSTFGGAREGLVIRIRDSFSNDDFSKSIVKWVRKNHVQTDDHWMHQEIIKQRRD